MAKVVCDECGSSFPLERVKNMQNCPVCGEVLWDEESETEKNDLLNKLEKADKSMMHVNQVHYPDSQMEGFIRIQCKKCLDILYIDIDDAEVIKEDYIKLKYDSNVECEKCGYKHAERYLTYCETISTNPLLPHCPICNSTMLKKIKTSSKILAAATLGKFALPYNSKTYECQNCNYKF